MNAFQIMLGQGGIAIGALMWGWGVTQSGLNVTFLAAAILALLVWPSGIGFPSTLPPKLALMPPRSIRIGISRLP